MILFLMDGLIMLSLPSPFMYYLLMWWRAKVCRYSYDLLWLYIGSYHAQPQGTPKQSRRIICNAGLNIQHPIIG